MNLNGADRIARLQHPIYIFPPTMSEPNRDPRLQISSPTHTRDAFSTPIRPPADTRMGAARPPVSATSAVPKTGQLQKAMAVLEIQCLKERIGTLEEENESLKNSISKIEREARKEKTRIGDELISLRELIGAMQQESKARFEMMEVDDEDGGSDASNGMVLDEETTVKIERSHAAANSNVFLVSFCLSKQIRAHLSGLYFTPGTSSAGFCRFYGLPKQVNG